MKPSKRNIANATAKAEKLAAGKPIVSKYEAKRLTDEERAARLTRAHPTSKGGVRAP